MIRMQKSERWQERTEGQITDTDERSSIIHTSWSVSWFHLRLACLETMVSETWHLPLCFLSTGLSYQLGSQPRYTIQAARFTECRVALEEVFKGITSFIFESVPKSWRIPKRTSGLRGKYSSGIKWEHPVSPLPGTVAAKSGLNRVCPPGDSGAWLGPSTLTGSKRHKEDVGHNRGPCVWAALKWHFSFFGLCSGLFRGTIKEVDRRI